MAMSFEPILILYAFLAVVQLILTMLPGVWYTRKVRHGPWNSPCNSWRPL